MRIAGGWFDGVTSRRSDAQLELGGDASLTVVVDGAHVRTVAFRDADVADRIGDTPRVIRFADGAAFETSDNDAVDALLARLGASPVARLVHVLESRWRAALLTLVVVAAGTWTLAVWGLPILAERVARSLPPSVHVAIGAQALEALDGSLFAPSTMPERRQERLRTRFDALVGEPRPEPDVTVHFRAGQAVGANAFALPSGDVIVTDELVALAEHDDEVMAVLAHELGHVVHRHGLRQLLQSSVATLVVMSLAGDAGAVTSIAAGLPGLLLNAGYSRGFEREADAFALEQLRARGIDPVRFADVLERLEKKAGAWPSALGYLSTHPATADRVAPFRGAGP